MVINSKAAVTMGDGDPQSPYEGPAGGWAALSASVRQLFRKRAIFRGGRALLRMNQDQGFDCPGCAWPEPAHRSSLEFCENGVKAVAEEGTGRRITAAFFREHTVTELLERPDRWLEDQGRLTEPMVYEPKEDRYVPVTWDAAFAHIGAHLQALESPDDAIFYTSGRTSNEAAFLYQLFCREYGTNNLPDCANMCHESSGKALGEVIGTGKGTVTLEDFQRADAIFVWGQNPGTNHPRMLTELEKASRRGAQIVSINPLRERGLESFLHPQHVGAMLTGRATPISTLYLQPVLGGDMALIKGMIKCVLAADDATGGETLDRSFVEEHTEGFDAVAEDARATPWDLITTQSGVSREEIQRAAEVFLSAGSVIACWAMGLTQHRHAVATLQTLVNLMLMRGQVGRPGAGFCPVRGHSNVQGDRTMGITSWPKPAFLDALEQVFGFAPPREDGLDVVGAIEAMSEGAPRTFFALGGNFAAATPDTDHVAAALRRCSLTVQVSTKLNRSHLVHGREAYILPCLSRSERDTQGGRVQRVTVEDSMSMVHPSQGRLSPSGPRLLSEPAIVSRLAQATLPGSVVPWEELVEDYDRIRDRIAQVLPAFRGYNQRMDEHGGFYLGNSAAERSWNTATGKAQFTVHPIPDLTLPPGQLRLMTIRSHDQYNTTIYGDDDRYRGVRGQRRVVFLNKEDMEERSIQNGQLVDLISCFEDGERQAPGFRALTYNIPRGCAAAYFPETNVLVSVTSVAEVSRTPTSKLIPIRLEASAP